MLPKPPLWQPHVCLQCAVRMQRPCNALLHPRTQQACAQCVCRSCNALPLPRLQQACTQCACRSCKRMRACSAHAGPAMLCVSLTTEGVHAVRVQVLNRMQRSAVPLPQQACARRSCNSMCARGAHAGPAMLCVCLTTADVRTVPLGHSSV
eukprot:1138986-Pelagomonas_calceolata.AAC.1